MAEWFSDWVMPLESKNVRKDLRMEKPLKVETNMPRVFVIEFNFYI